MNKINDINLQRAIRLSLIDESKRKEKMYPEIPKSIILSAIANGMGNKIIFYEYCQDIYKKINDFLMKTISDVKNKNHFSERKKYFRIVLLSENTLKEQLRILSSEKSNDYIYDFMNLFCKDKNIKITPMAVLLLKSSFKFHMRLNEIFSGINYFWIHILGYLY